jgi:hypothetical protein
VTRPNVSTKAQEHAQRGLLRMSEAEPQTRGADHDGGYHFRGAVLHDVRTLVAPRVFGLALGYEDLVDHDTLRRDPILGAMLGKLERRAEALAPLAGKSTLNRMKHAPEGATGRYHKIGHDSAAIAALFVDLFLDAHSKPPREIVLDLDATDDPLHGHQEGRFFHGYDDCYCYLPLL